MEVLRLPLSASQKGRLISAGYTSIASLSSISPSQLALGSQNAWDMLQEEKTLVRITTSCADLDDILGGGISCKEVTEIGGVPGIDTEGSFMVERALQIAEACSADMVEYSCLYRKGSQACEVKRQPKDFLENIFYFRVCSYTEQIALVNYLEKFITEHKDVKVVIVDSVTFHFRQDFDDMALRTRLLSGMALKLMKLARKFSVAELRFKQQKNKTYVNSSNIRLEYAMY
ncbi:DNA recombination and repair protein Rad51, C-terminal [Cynara cardunculus var. scolymus]|uniref:DNA repair protein RAD51 homolog 3 n=1 Tax=Cynara cardunculus var. scolymus TaxID=59895 RepID=A0A103XEE4_CYNCS|nr:DNA recombination and repair protein Rad51, C-terminal [Cynara cardunculus var. scolymus]